MKKTPRSRTQDFSASPHPQGVAARILKKYPNRRLYDTQTSSYITLADVKKMVLLGENFLVQDAKTQADLTRSVLLQIIFEEEAGAIPMFSTAALTQLIQFHGHAMQNMMGAFFEKNLRMFADMQNQLTIPAPITGSTVAMTPEVWSQLLSGQTASAIPDLMTPYLEQSRQILTQLQESILGSLK